MLRILEVIPGLNNDSGPTQVVKNLSEKLVQEGHQVDICFITGRGRDLEVTMDSKIGIIPCKVSFFKNWAFSFELITFLKSELNNYDIIHLHSIWLFPNIAVWWYARKYDKKYIIRPAGSLEPWAFKSSSLKKRIYYNLIERHIINGAAGIQTASSKETETIKSYSFYPPIIEIPNGINNVPDPNENLRLGYGYMESDFIVLFLGRIAPVKNLEFLLRVLGKLKPKIPDLKVIIAGPVKDDYAHSVKKQFEKSKLSVLFTGAVMGQKKEDLFNIADVFILPSLSENFAIAVAEALSAGLPVIASDETPWKSLELKNAGYCLPLVEEQFEKGIFEIYYKGKAHYTSFAKDFAKEFEWSNIAKHTTQSFEKLLDE